MNTAGTTSSDSSVEVISPPITAMAIGERKLGSAPQPIAIGSMPAPIAIVVITIGRARLWHASTSASKRDSPLRRATIAYSTSRIEFLVTMPISISRPISDGIEKLLPVMSSSTNAPPIDSGSAARIVTGCMKSRNSSTSTM